MLRFAVLMTCHNRVATTLECLRRLFAARRPEGVLFDVWLNDDGSTDGTGEKCRAFFAARNTAGWRGEAHIVQGSGNDYWCGGMRRAWAAASVHADYDGYLWLNDDTWLLPDAFEVLFGGGGHSDSILVGAISSRDGRETTYGGEANHRLAVPDGSWQMLDQMNGNVVWIPRAVFSRLGNLDRHWTHAMGDGDYSRTARERGISVLLSPSFVATCERTARPTAWRDGNVPLFKRLKSLYSPLGYGEPQNMFRYCLRHDGLRVALRIWLSCHWQVLFPKKGTPSCAC